MRQLERELKRGAYVQGYAEDYWTLDRIGRLIWDMFEVRYHSGGVWHILQRLGWSCQKPQRRALQRDDAVVAHWKRSVWPRIKKVA
jgi:transposase